MNNMVLDQHISGEIEGLMLGVENQSAGLVELYQ